jgi:hypothetical protein
MEVKFLFPLSSSTPTNSLAGKFRVRKVIRFEVVNGGNATRVVEHLEGEGPLLFKYAQWNELDGLELTESLAEIWLSP